MAPAKGVAGWGGVSLSGKLSRGRRPKEAKGSGSLIGRTPGSPTLSLFLLHCFSLLAPGCSALVTGRPLRPRGPGTATPSSPSKGAPETTERGGQVWWPGESAGLLLHVAGGSVLASGVGRDGWMF